MKRHKYWLLGFLVAFILGLFLGIFLTKNWKGVSRQFQNTLRQINVKILKSNKVKSNILNITFNPPHNVTFEYRALFEGEIEHIDFKSGLSTMNLLIVKLKDCNRSTHPDELRSKKILLADKWAVALERGNTGRYGYESNGGGIQIGNDICIGISQTLYDRESESIFDDILGKAK